MSRFHGRHQRNKLKLDDVPKPPEWQRLRHQHSVTSMGAEMPAVPNLVIRRPSVVAGVGGGGVGNVIGLAGLKGGRKNRSVFSLMLNSIVSFCSKWSLLPVLIMVSFPELESSTRNNFNLYIVVAVCV